MSFSQHLRKSADEIWEAQHAHPFVTGIGDGTLNLTKFGYWLRQDYLYLIDYARLFGAGMLKAPSLELMNTMAQMGHEILHTEMDLHRSYVAEFGITAKELEAETKAPTCQGYTDFLLRTATVGDFPELMGALLPCIWGYGEVGERLASRDLPDDDRLRRWIEMYASEEFLRLGDWCRAATDEVCEGLPPSVLKRVADAFVTSSRYELAFWEMAWTGETWPE
jgi:thiaminase (transcriptional activator TenA)